jgi:GAF domain-containing protein
VRLLPPSRLAGRDAEVAALEAAFAGAREGQCRGVLVVGAPGVGKTALIDQLRPVVTGGDGWFLAGKFDQYRRDLEFDAGFQAFRALGRLLLTEPEDELTRVRDRIVAAVGPNEGLLTAVLPEFAVLAADFAILVRYDASDTLEVVGTWTSTGAPAPTPVGERLPLGGRNVITLVWRTGRPAQIDYDDAISGTIGQVATDWGLRSSVGVPVSVEDRLWGAMVAAFTRPEHLPGDTETRLAGFTELVATAIANAGAQAEVTASRARIVAAADQARRQIERDLHDGAQQRLVTLALQLRAAQAAVPPELGELGAELDRAAAGAAGALDELREIARGIHPAILAEGLALERQARQVPGAMMRRCEPQPSGSLEEGRK